MIETDILKALQAGGIAAFNASGLAAITGWTPATRIKPVGIVLDPLPDDGCYLEFVNIPNNRGGDFWGDQRVYQGNFRLILHWKIDQTGPYSPSGYMDQIGGYFTKGLRLVQGQASVQIYDVPIGSGPIENGSELLFPVAVPYRCFEA